MIAFLTSSFIPYQDRGGDYRAPELSDENEFADRLLSVWPHEAKLLFFSSDPTDHDENDFRAKELRDALELDEMQVGGLIIVDDREERSTEELVEWADVIFLAGGHAPTQLEFMRERHLKECLNEFDGVLLALSAGSVNAAEEAYLIPELPGESISPHFLRFAEGLGISAVQIVPHANSCKDIVLDGKRYIEDIVVPDSYGRHFYLIPDGSYFMIRNGVTHFYGTGELIEDGCRKPVESGVVIPAASHISAPLWSALAADGYDMVFTLDPKKGKCFFYHVGRNAQEILDGAGSGYSEICEKIAVRLVEEEIDAFIDQSALDVVTAEVEERGSFVRTAHMQTESGRRAKNMRVRKVPGCGDIYLCTWFDISTAIDHDWMTDEYARTGFMDEAERLIPTLSYDEDFSIIYTNVKGFKAVNELFGSQNGDMVIFQTRDAIRQTLKPLILGRLESDHYVMLVNSKNVTPRRLNALSRQTYRTGYKEYHFEIQFGIYGIKDRSVTIGHMIDRARIAEKSIREEKGDCFAWYDDLVRENYVRQRVLLSDVKNAMDTGEFRPYYQPVVDAKSGDIRSAEALIRWNHHEMGLVSPADFIPVIEDGGKVSALDYYVVDKVLDFVEDRAAAGKPVVPCAVNLSRIDFYDPTLMNHIIERFENSDHAPALVRIEVTESAYADLERNAMGYLEELKKAGVRILLDDFGSGMSSLSTLESFDFDIVKLDIGFIRKIGIRQKAESIIESTIRLSHALGARVTAEGVETKKQLDFLRSVDCDYIQGYYFYRPISEGDFARLLENGLKKSEI